MENTTVLWTDIWTTVAWPALTACRYWTGIIVTLPQNAQKNSTSFKKCPHFLHVPPSPCWFTRKSPPQNLSSLLSWSSHMPKCITSCLTYPQAHFSERVSPGIVSVHWTDGPGLLASLLLGCIYMPTHSILMNLVLITDYRKLVHAYS